MVAALSAKDTSSIGELRLQLEPLLGLRKHEDGLRGLTKVKAHPLVFGLGNLFLCGYFDHLIRGSEGAFYLDLFLALTAVVTAILYVGLFMQHPREVLFKSMALPVSQPARFLFGWLDIARRPLFLSLVLTDFLFFTIIYHSPIPALLLVFFIADIQLLLACVMTKASGGSSYGAVFGLVTVALCALTASSLFRVDAFGTGLPLVAWVSAGILGAQSGSSGAMAWAFVKIGFVAAVLICIGVMRFSTRSIAPGSTR